MIAGIPVFLKSLFRSYLATGAVHSRRPFSSEGKAGLSQVLRRNAAVTGSWSSLPELRSDDGLV